MCVKDEGKTIVTGGSDGRVIEWKVADGQTKSYDGEGHSSQINGLTCNTSNGTVSSIGIDDSLRFANVMLCIQCRRINMGPQTYDSRKNPTFLFWNRHVDTDSAKYSSAIAPLKLKSQPKGIDSHEDLTAVVTLDTVLMMKNGSTVQEEKVDYEPSSVSISKDCQNLAVGDASQGTILGTILKRDSKAVYYG